MLWLNIDARTNHFGLCYFSPVPCTVWIIYIYSIIITENLFSWNPGSLILFDFQVISDDLGVVKKVCTWSNSCLVYSSLNLLFSGCKGLDCPFKFHRTVECKVLSKFCSRRVRKHEKEWHCRGQNCLVLFWGSWFSIVLKCHLYRCMFTLILVI